MQCTAERHVWDFVPLGKCMCGQAAIPFRTIVKTNHYLDESGKKFRFYEWLDTETLKEAGWLKEEQTNGIH